MGEDTRLILESINGLKTEINTRFSEMETHINDVESRLSSRIDNVESRLSNVVTRIESVENLVNISLKAIDENFRLIKEIRAKQDETELATKANSFDIAVLRGKAQ